MEAGGLLVNFVRFPRNVSGAEGMRENKAIRWAPQSVRLASLSTAEVGSFSVRQAAPPAARPSRAGRRSAPSESIHVSGRICRPTEVQTVASFVASERGRLRQMRRARDPSAKAANTSSGPSLRIPTKSVSVSAEFVLTSCYYATSSKVTSLASSCREPVTSSPLEGPNRAADINQSGGRAKKSNRIVFLLAV